MSEKETSQARMRLIDHFKRVYTIVVGLAITEAVRRIFPVEPANVPLSVLFMFFTFFITLVPIFHGGDRSLDFKYADTSQNSAKEKLHYLWDVYMLILTAILFVCIAEAIPSRKVGEDGLSVYKNPDLFYLFMFITLLFDVVILIIDRAKSTNKSGLKTYLAWIIANCILAGVCLYVYWVVSHLKDPTDWSLVRIGCVEVSFLLLNLMVFVMAFLRTIIDYASDHLSKGRFLFP